VAVMSPIALSLFWRAKREAYAPVLATLTKTVRCRSNRRYIPVDVRWIRLLTNR
jgi:hypothetical protein